MTTVQVRNTIEAVSRVPEYLRSWLARRGQAVERVRSDAVGVRAHPEVVRCLVDDFQSTRVVLFGSLGREDVSGGFDVDLAVRGLAPARYFEALARVSEILEKNVDLVDLDAGARQSLIEHIEQTGEVLYDVATS